MSCVSSVSFHWHKAISAHVSEPQMTDINLASFTTVYFIVHTLFRDLNSTIRNEPQYPKPARVSTDLSCLHVHVRERINSSGADHVALVNSSIRGIR